MVKVKNKLQWSAVAAFAGLIVIIMIVNKAKGRQVMKARKVLSARSWAHQKMVNPIARAQMDRLSGTTRYSRDFLSGRSMGAHPHIA